jgi:hypothetical protein
MRDNVIVIAYMLFVFALMLVLLLVTGCTEIGDFSGGYASTYEYYHAAQAPAPQFIVPEQHGMISGISPGNFDSGSSPIMLSY